MEKLLKTLKWIALTLFLVTLIAIIWASFPQVKYVKNELGNDFDKSQNWNQDSIQEIKSYLSKAKFVDAFVAIQKDKEIFSYGETEKLIDLHSVRKPIISLLIGIARDKGLIDLNETLGKLGIREKGVELTETEKSATVRNLLMARSGVYIDADAQPTMDGDRPERGRYKPGQFYYYNNFDFNVLGTILKLKTGMSYEECLYNWLAVPLEMQEFHIENIVYGTPFSKTKTQHPAYKTWMSARDLAKIGSVISQKGVWKGKRIVSEVWIEESTKPYHVFHEEDKVWPIDAYSYLWSVDTEKGNIWGTGYGGQYLMIDTTNQLVLVQRHFTGNSLLAQGLYLMENSQSSPVDLMQVWYTLLRNIKKEN